MSDADRDRDGDDQRDGEIEPPETGAPNIETILCPCGTEMDTGRLGGWVCPHCGLKAGARVEVTDRGK